MIQFPLVASHSIVISCTHTIFHLKHFSLKLCTYCSCHIFHYKNKAGRCVCVYLLCFSVSSSLKALSHSICFCCRCLSSPRSSGRGSILSQRERSSPRLETTSGSCHGVSAASVCGFSIRTPGNRERVCRHTDIRTWRRQTNRQTKQYAMCVDTQNAILSVIRSAKPI